MADITIVCNTPRFSFNLYGSALSVTNKDVIANKLNFSVDLSGVGAYTPPVIADPALATYFDCDYTGSGSTPIGRLSFDLGIFGECVNIWIDSDTLSFSFGIDGSNVEGDVVTVSTLSFDFKLNTKGADDSSAFVHVEVSNFNKVMWSKIGSLDFTIDHSNEAGEGYIKELGVLYSLCKLNDNIAVYGRDCIGLMTPNQTAWGFRKLSDVGIKGRDAQVGTDKVHWYIDSNGDLCELSSDIKKIGYKEFLSVMTNPVMILDKLRDFIYICDGTYGYTYSCKDNSLGSSGINVSGFGYDKTTAIICSPEVVDIPTITFTTDIYDMNTRKEKTIFNIEISTDTPQTMEAAINYRMSHADTFISTPWVKFTPRGIAYLPCYGVEFQIKFRMSTWTDFAIDQLKINGIIHGFSFLDSLERNY